RKKAQWYLKRELAALIPTESRSIRLTFEAKGSGHKVGDYMVEERYNKCVSCGGSKDLTIHHVVPEMYRHWMPLSIKSKSSRDLLLLCKQCHTRYEAEAVKLKKKIASRYNVPLEGIGWISLPEYKRVKKAASALIRSSDKIPKDRLLFLESTVRDFWVSYEHKKDEDDWETVLSKCSLLEDHFRGPDFREHGDIVITDLTKNMTLNEKGEETWPDLEAFIKQWRKHFLDHLKPSHLSSLWTVDGDIYSR
ncbi:hypothetical protein BDB01DRAFT_716015, partial [Pilobolus umbonatus]